MNLLPYLLLKLLYPVSGDRTQFQVVLAHLVISERLTNLLSYQPPGIMSELLTELVPDDNAQIPPFIYFVIAPTCPQCRL